MTEFDINERISALRGQIGVAILIAALAIVAAGFWWLSGVPFSDGEGSRRTISRSLNVAVVVGPDGSTLKPENWRPHEEFRDLDEDEHVEVGHLIISEYESTKRILGIPVSSRVDYEVQIASHGFSESVGGTTTLDGAKAALKRGRGAWLDEWVRQSIASAPQLVTQYETHRSGWIHLFIAAICVTIGVSSAAIACVKSRSLAAIAGRSSNPTQCPWCGYPRVERSAEERGRWTCPECGASEKQENRDTGDRQTSPT